MNKEYERYSNLRDTTSDLLSCLCNNDIMFLKLEAIKEMLEEETILMQKNNDYNLGAYDELNLIKDRILKIIDK